jgi:hypothetical protein
MELMQMIGKTWGNDVTERDIFDATDANTIQVISLTDGITEFNAKPGRVRVVTGWKDRILAMSIESADGTFQIISDLD